MKEIDFINELKKALTSIDVDISDETAEKFKQFKDLLVSWNEKINLTAITEDEDIIWKHFVDCAALSKVIENKQAKLIDVGSGAGFPGVPLKLICPNVEITLLDSLDKRVKYLNTVIEEIGLQDISAIHARAEDAGRDDGLREKFDFVTARAVAAMPVLAEYCLPFVKVGGCFVAMKAEKTEEEIASAKGALNKLGAEIKDVISLNIGPEKAERTLIVIEKAAHISDIYPRRAGIPTKKPL